MNKRQVDELKFEVHDQICKEARKIVKNEGLSFQYRRVRTQYSQPKNKIVSVKNNPRIVLYVDEFAEPRVIRIQSECTSAPFAVHEHHTIELANPDSFRTAAKRMVELNKWLAEKLSEFHDISEKIRNNLVYDDKQGGPLSSTCRISRGGCWQCSGYTLNLAHVEFDGIKIKYYIRKDCNNLDRIVNSIDKTIKAVGSSSSDE